MISLESREIGICNFDYFAIDMTDDGSYLMRGKEHTLGEAGCAIANLSKDTVTQLLILAGWLNKTRIQIEMTEEFTSEPFRTAGNQIRDILDYIKDTEPFSWFDIPDSRRIVDEIFNEDNFMVWDEIYKYENPDELPDSLLILVPEADRKFDLAKEFIRVYCYLANDTANFGNLILNFTSLVMDAQGRKKSNLAMYAAGYCNFPSIKLLLEAANINKDMDGVNLRPRVSHVPVILWNEEKQEYYLARRVYFGRLMDFFVNEWFEGLMRGHYLWQCGVCQKYFLLTTAHKQLYCGQYNPEYGTSCDHVANNRRFAQKLGLTSQKQKDNPIHVLRKKRHDSIRKNKSLGKYSKTVSDEAKRILDACYEKAQLDANYAQTQFEQDIELENLYKQATKAVT